MTEPTQLWLFGIIGGWLLLLSGAVLKLLIDQVKIRVAVDLFVDSLGEKLAKVLHSDDDHLKLDELLDKLLLTYRSRFYELSLDEWNQLKNACDSIASDVSYNKVDRGLAGMLSAVAEHKMMLNPGSKAPKYEI